MKIRLVCRVENEDSGDIQEDQHASNTESHIKTAKDNSETHATPKRGISMNLVTPSPTLEENARLLASNRIANSSSYSSATLALVTLNLVSNAASHSSFRPKRRSHHAPTDTSIYSPLKRESKASCFTSLSLPTPKKASTSKVKCALSPSFPQILTAISEESCLKPSKPKKNEIAKEEVTLKNIFASSKKGSAPFHKILEEKGIFMPASQDLSALTHEVPCHGKRNDLFSF